MIKGIRTAAPRSQCSPVNTGTSIHALHGSLLQRGAGAIPARVVLTVLLFELQIHELAAIRKSSAGTKTDRQIAIVIHL